MTDLTDKEVKARPKPTLTDAWWKTAWTGEKPAKAGKQMLDALKAYKEAKRGTSQADLLSSLSAIMKARHALADDAAKIKELNRRTAILTDLIILQNLASDEHAKASKIGGGTREVFRYDFGDRVAEAIKGTAIGDRLTINSKPHVVELLEAVVQELDGKNALNALFASYSNTLDDIVTKAAAALIQLGKTEDDAKALKDEALKILGDHVDMLEDIHHKVPTAVLKKMGLNAAMEAEYRKALNARRKNIAKTFVLTVASGAAIALPGTQAFAIYGFARSVAGLTQQLIEHNMKITTAARLLEGHLKFLRDAFSNGAKRFASETGATTLNAVLGVDILPTLDKATSSFKDLKLNTTHSAFRVQKLTDAIMEAMDSSAEARKKAEAARPGHASVKKLMKDADKAEKELDKLLKATADLARQVAIVERKLPVLGKIVQGLGKNSRAQDIVNFTAKTLVNLGAIAGGGLVDATAACTAADAAVKGAEEISAMVIATAGFVNEMKGSYDAIRSA